MVIPDIKELQHFNYWLMVASEGLLERAIEKSPEGPLKGYFKHHLDEERGHVGWLKADLERLGVEPVIDYRAVAIAGGQYYLINHVDPAMLLGYMFALEGEPKNTKLVDAIEAKHGPLKSLRYHTTHDPDHAEDLRQMIDSLPKPLWRQVVENWDVCYKAMVDIFDTMKKEEI